MTSSRVVAVLMACAVLMLSACTSSNGNGKFYEYSSAQAVGSLIPVADRKPVDPFGGSLISGGTYDLAKYTGKAVVVNFWGTWCGPCTIETPEFGQIYQAYQAKDVTFVGIAIKENSISQPRSFVKDNHVTYPIIYDEADATAVRMGNVDSRVVPFTVLLDKQHRVAGVYAARLQTSTLDPMLDKLIAE